MKKTKVWFLSTVLSIVLALSACALPAESTVQSSVSEDLSSDIQDREFAPQISESPFALSDICPYADQPYIVVNDNIPYFSEENLTTESFACYSDLDALGRCGVAYACIGLDSMPTEERGQISNIEPSGWHNVKYHDSIDGNYLYNRCHLIGYQLSGENANEKNLITGTRYLNIQGMLPFENLVADYIEETANHVLYRVTPVFEDNNLVASGVLMEAKSVEDEGEGVLFCVYVYNVQPDITIDYATGESSVNLQEQTSAPGFAATPVPVQVPASESASQSVDASPEGAEVSREETDYILNINTNVFHYPDCVSVKQIKEKNKQAYHGARDEVISMGYDACKKCNP